MEPRGASGWMKRAGWIGLRSRERARRAAVRGGRFSRRRVRRCGRASPSRSCGGSVERSGSPNAAGACPLESPSPVTILTGINDLAAKAQRAQRLAKVVFERSVLQRTPKTLCGPLCAFAPLRLIRTVPSRQLRPRLGAIPEAPAPFFVSRYSAGEARLLRRLRWTRDPTSRRAAERARSNVRKPFPITRKQTPSRPFLFLFKTRHSSPVTSFSVRSVPTVSVGGFCTASTRKSATRVQTSSNSWRPKPA
jgi:hypothetical protein